MADPQAEAQRLRAKECIDAGVRAGAINALWAAAIATPPTLIVCRTVPWAKANLNHTAQALVISASAIAAYFISSEKTILECTRKKSWAAVREARGEQSTT